ETTTQLKTITPTLRPHIIQPRSPFMPNAVKPGSMQQNTRLALWCDRPSPLLSSPIPDAPLK
ncbi:MAG: hypothetical protein ACYTX0_38850, partial [Nostoc sp.]